MVSTMVLPRYGPHLDDHIQYVLLKNYLFVNAPRHPFQIFEAMKKTHYDTSKVLAILHDPQPYACIPQKNFLTLFCLFVCLFTSGKNIH